MYCRKPYRPHPEQMSSDQIHTVITTTTRATEPPVADEMTLICQIANLASNDPRREGLLDQLWNLRHAPDTCPLCGSRRTPNAAAEQRRRAWAF